MNVATTVLTAVQAELKHGPASTRQIFLPVATFHMQLYQNVDSKATNTTSSATELFVTAVQILSTAYNNNPT